MRRHDVRRVGGPWCGLFRLTLAALLPLAAARGGEPPPAGRGPDRGGGRTLAPQARGREGERRRPAAEPARPRPEPKAEPVTAEPAEFTDDLVILKNDLAIEGKVLRRSEESVYVLVPPGVLEIPRQSVKRIEFNLSSRLAELAPDDFAGRYRVAVSALEEGNTEEAKPVLEDLVGKDGVPSDVLRRLARIYESQGELAKALDLWKRYALANPADEEAKARIAELEKKPGAEQAPGQSGSAAAGQKVEEGIEAGNWEVLNWGNPCTVSVQPLDGNQVLMVEMPAGGGKDKAAVGRSLNLDLSDREKLRFNVFNAEKSRCEVAIALITAADYFESRTVAVRPDWNLDLEIDLKAKDFKSKETNWRFETAVKSLDQVKQVILLVYGGRQKALLYFDAIRAE